MSVKCIEWHEGQSEPRSYASSPLGVGRLIVGRTGLPNNVYIVWDPATMDAVVVDPGWAAPVVKSVFQRFLLRARGILITHCHLDHCRDAGHLAASLACPVYGSAKACSSAGYSEWHRPLALEDCIIEMGSLTVRAYYTPGHTACSFSYNLGDLLFTGDLLFAEGCGLIGKEDGDAREMFRSVRKLRDLVDDDWFVCAGHSYRLNAGLPFGVVRRCNLYLQFNDEDRFVRFCERPSRMKHLPPKVEEAGIISPMLQWGTRTRKV